MDKKLKIADKLALPLDAVTQKIAWLGRTGSGKTFGCKRAVEQMLHAGAQVVVLDGSGGWAGLRLGKKAFKIPVLGGLYGDIPLESTAGALVADVIVDRETSMVLDVSQMLDAERTRFATAFAQRFFQRKKASPGAVHLVLEECQDFVPENPQRGEEHMLHEFQRLAKQGRPHGIGISFISQRPQEISKKALNQAECVFAFQMNGPHERKALQYWLSDKGFEGKIADVLPTLEVGCPYVWSPQWLKISVIVRILPIESLDTSSTPKVGKAKARRETLKPIDLRALNTAMAATIERAKADDPKILKARIAELEKAVKTGAPPKPAAPVLGLDQMIMSRKSIDEIVGMVDGISQKVAACDKLVGELGRALGVTQTSLRRAAVAGSKALPARHAPTPPAPARSTSQTPPPTKPSQRLNGASNGHVRLGTGERAVMMATAQHTPSGGVTRSQLTILTGYKRSTRDAYIHRLCKAGYMEGPGLDSGTFVSTPTGEAWLGDFEPLPTGRSLLEHWLRKLPEGERKILELAAAAYPDTIDRDQISADTGYARSSRDAYIHRLGARKLIETQRGGVVQMREELS